MLFCLCCLNFNGVASTNLCNHYRIQLGWLWGLIGSCYYTASGRGCNGVCLISLASFKDGVGIGVVRFVAYRDCSQECELVHCNVSMYLCWVQLIWIAAACRGTELKVIYVSLWRFHYEIIISVNFVGLARVEGSRRLFNLHVHFITMPSAHRWCWWILFFAFLYHVRGQWWDLYNCWWWPRRWWSSDIRWDIFYIQFICSKLIVSLFFFLKFECAISSAICWLTNGTFSCSRTYAGSDSSMWTSFSALFVQLLHLHPPVLVLVRVALPGKGWWGLEIYRCEFAGRPGLDLSWHMLCLAGPVVVVGHLASLISWVKVLVYVGRYVLDYGR